MKVELLHCTPPSLASRAAKVCVGADEPDGWTDADRAAFLSRLIEQGHESVIEHVTLSFLVEGLSRACLQQLARHRTPWKSSGSSVVIWWRSCPATLPGWWHYDQTRNHRRDQTQGGLLI
jgi:hypothetical protein